MGIYFIIAARNLLQARRRSLLLGLAFAMVMLLLVFLLGLSEGITENMIKSAITLSTGHVNVAGFYKASAADAAPIVTGAAEVRQVMTDSMKDSPTPLVALRDRGRGWARVISATGAQFAGITGIDPKEEGDLAKTLLVAREDTYVEKDGSADRKGDLSRLGEPGSVVLFASQAKKLKVRVGDVLTLVAQAGRMNNSADVTVVAVCEDIGLLSSFSMFVSKQTGNDLYQLKPDTAGAIQVIVGDIDKSDDVMERLRASLEKKGYRLMDHDSNPFWLKFPLVQGDDWLGQKLDLTTWHDEVSFLAKIVSGFVTISISLISVLVLVIMVGIMNTMWMSVRERTGEIGTLRAIGMQRGSVLLMFLLEAMILAAAASTAGAIAGAGIVTLIDHAQWRVPSEAIRIILISDKLHLVVVPWEIAVSVGVFTLVAGLAALLPSTRAARMQPVTAIQQVE
jgi:putative ABC transport system permease protein